MSEKSITDLTAAAGAEESYVNKREEKKKKKNAEKLKPVTVVKPYVLGKKRSSNDDNQDKAVKITRVDGDKAVKITRVDEDVAGKISEDVKRNPEYRCINCSRIFKYRSSLHRHKMICNGKLRVKIVERPALI